MCDNCFNSLKIKERKDNAEKVANELTNKIEIEFKRRKDKSISSNVFSKGFHGYATPYQRLEYVRYYMWKFPEKAKAIRELPYNEFLNHWYWWVISTYMKHKNENCALCGSTEKLNVHHKTYKK